MEGPWKQIGAKGGKWMDAASICAQHGAMDGRGKHMCTKGEMHARGKHMCTTGGNEWTRQAYVYNRGKRMDAAKIYAPEGALVGTAKDM